ncbi:MAG: MerR family transcriptional regulator [Oscillospiraceae bacterium]|jgi:DNA-binding transcriptional MerR regulator/effector-binding domain-containing protein|nr:MerR family transcriptional regulator [Oscillospiraceae bacterium]
MNKTGMMSIKEFSEFTTVPQSMLRYYDKIGLFRPMLRGDNNYRYYAYHQIVTLNQIIKLTDLKVPLKEIEYMSAERTPQSTVVLLEKQEKLLKAELNSISDSLSVIRTLQRLLNLSFTIDENALSVCDNSELAVTFSPKTDFGDCGTFYKAFKEACRWFRENGINLCYPIGGYFSDFTSFVEKPSKPDKFFSLDPAGQDKKPAGKSVTGYIRGYYGEMSDLPERLKEYGAANKLSYTGGVYVTYIQDEVSIPTPGNYLAQAAVMI